MRRAILLLMTLSAMMGGQQGPQTAANPNYFPLAVGNRWEYQTAAEPAREIREVIAEEITGQEHWFKVRTSFEPNPLHRPVSETWVRLDGDRLFVGGKTQDGKDSSKALADFSAPVTTRYPVSGFCSKSATNVTDGDTLTIRYQNVCSDAGIMSATYRLNVGLESETQESFFGLRIRKLTAARISGKDLKF